jgi:hypothetical protein
MKKEILEKLYSSKVELSEVKVDLALIDDFNADINSGIKVGSLLKKNIIDNEKNLRSYLKLKDDLETQRKNLESELEGIKTFIHNIKAYKNRTDKTYSEIVKRASDLGVDYPKVIDTVKKELDDLVEYTESINPNIKL